MLLTKEKREMVAGSIRFSVWTIRRSLLGEVVREIEVTPSLFPRPDQALKKHYSQIK